MIIVTKSDVTDAEIDHIRERIESLGMRTHLSRGERRTIIGCIGDESLLDEVPLRSLPGVEAGPPVPPPRAPGVCAGAAGPQAAQPRGPRVRGGSHSGARGWAGCASRVRRPGD